MSEVPTNWAIATLGEITEAKVAQPGPRGDGTFTYVDISSIDNQMKEILDPKILPVSEAPSRAKQEIQTNDVLVSMTRPNLNAVARVPTELNGAIASTGFHVLRVVEVEPEWVSMRVCSKEFVREMSDLVQGALYPAVRPFDIQAHRFPVPPLPEQRRIVAKIETLMARSRKAREVLTQIPSLLNSYRRSLLASAFSGRLTEDWRTENKVEGWKRVELRNICRSITDGDHQAPPTALKGVPFITIGAINDGRLRLEKATRFVPVSYYEGIKADRRAQKGDVLYSVTGSIGIAALVDTPDQFVFQRHIAILKPDPNQVSNRFLYYLLNSDEIKQQGLAVATGTAQLTIPLTGLRAFSLDLPLLEEQREITRRIDSLLSIIERFESLYFEARDQSESLDQSILDKAFRGELVPQDPADEPAEILLARIRSQKTASAPAQPKRGRPKAAPALPHSTP